VLGVLLGRFERDDAAPAPLAGKSTLIINRLEHAPANVAGGRYHKIGHDAAAIEAVFVDLFLDAFRAKPPREPPERAGATVGISETAYELGMALGITALGRGRRAG
jgi:hypothetical protein